MFEVGSSVAWTPKKNSHAAVVVESRSEKTKIAIESGYYAGRTLIVSNTELKEI